jgi:hypothetical protein
MNPTTPHAQPPPGLTCAWFSLLRFRSPLLTESQLFSLPMGTEMFHFPTFPPHRLYIHLVVTPHHWCWVSPFGHPRITARLTTPRGLSRPPTSFIGSWYQGIHRTPLNTYNNTYKQPPHKERIECRHHKHCRQNLQIKMLASTMHFSNNTHRPPARSSTPHHKTHQQNSATVGPEETCVPSEPR